MQSTFAAALAALQASKRNAPFRPWLFRIAHNEAVTVIRRRRDAGQEIADSMLGSAVSASEEAENRARMALLMADLAKLPERQRAALLMRELNGLSHAEISVALDTSATAAKQAIFDARTALTEFAEGRALACEEVRRKISERDGRVLRSRRVRSHLQDCPGCASFAAAITERRADLRAFVPLLPAATSAALLAPPGGSVGARVRWCGGGREARYDRYCVQGRGERDRGRHGCRRARRNPVALPPEQAECPRGSWAWSRSQRWPRSSGLRHRPTHAVAADRQTARRCCPADATTSRPGTGEARRRCCCRHHSGRRCALPGRRPVPARRLDHTRGARGARGARQECAPTREERAVAWEEQRGTRPHQGRGQATQLRGQAQARTRPAQPGRDRRQVRRRPGTPEVRGRRKVDAYLRAARAFKPQKEAR